MNQQPRMLDAARRRILIVSSRVISAEQASPGNRCWLLADQLGRYYDVILALPQATGIFHPSCAVLYYEARSIGLLARDCDAVICDAAALAGHAALLGSGTPVAVDLASWEAPRSDGLRPDQQQVLAGADFFFCGDESSRRHWLGALERVGRINTYTRRDGKELRHLIDTVALDDKTKVQAVYWQLQALDTFCQAPRFARDRGTPFCLAPQPATAARPRWRRLVRRAARWRHRPRRN